jgi:hypothetical protein
MFVVAEPIPVYSLGVNAIVVLVNVIGNSAPAIPNTNRAPLIACEVEWKNKSSKNEMAVITRETQGRETIIENIERQKLLVNILGPR